MYHVKNGMTTHKNNTASKPHNPQTRSHTVIKHTVNHTLEAELNKGRSADSQTCWDRSGVSVCECFICCVVSVFVVFVYVCLCSGLYTVVSNAPQSLYVCVSVCGPMKNKASIDAASGSGWTPG